MDELNSLAVRIGFNRGLEAAAQMVDQARQGDRRRDTAAAIRAMKVDESYPPIEEVLGFAVKLDKTLPPGTWELRPPQADLLRHLPDQVADTMDRAQLAAWGKHD